MPHLRRRNERPATVVSEGVRGRAAELRFIVNNTNRKLCPDCDHELRWTKRINRFTCNHCLGAFTARRLSERLRDKEKTRTPESRLQMDAALQYLAKSDATPHAVVYYIRFRDALKIGTSTDVVQRLTHLPGEALLAIEPGHYNLESIRHQQFKPFRLTGEWFRYNAQTRAMVNKIRSDSLAWFAIAAQQMDGLPVEDDGGLFPLLVDSPCPD